MQYFSPQNYKLFFKYANLFTTIQGNRIKILLTPCE